MVFGHPGRTMGAMLETLAFAFAGTILGTGWVTLASFVSDRLHEHHPQAAYAVRAVVLVISFVVHGYLRSAVPKSFVGVLLFLLTVIIQMTTPIFTFSHRVATSFLFPFLTGIAICTVVNVVVFPEFSSGKVAVVTVDALQLAFDTLKDATDFFVSPTEEATVSSRQNARTSIEAAESPSSKSSDEKGNGDATEESSDGNPFDKLVAAKEKLRQAAASSKATLKETSFEICYSCLPPARLHGISSKGLEALVTSILTLIGACETKQIVLGPDEASADSAITDSEDSQSDRNSLAEKIENIRPKREAEVADEEFLRHLLEKVDEPLAVLRVAIQKGVDVLICCVEFSYDVPRTWDNVGRKPGGVPLKEIDIYVGAIETALDEFDKKTREALHAAAEEASEREEVEFDILPREEIFLVSSFLLNLRLAAQTTTMMLKDARALVEEYDTLQGKRRFHLPNFKSKKWLYSGESEQSETMDTGDRENVSRYRRHSGNGERSNSEHSPKSTDSKRTVPANPQKKVATKGEKEDEEEKSMIERIRGRLADVADWVMTNHDFHYALKLAVGGMLLSWPAFVPEFSNFFYNYRRLWVVIIYILVFENSVGTSVQIFLYRTVGTLCGSLWGYAAWTAGHGNPVVIGVMLYFGFLVAYYVQLNTRYVKAGMVLTISMVVVSVGTVIEYIPGTVPGTALANFGKRATAMIIGGSAALIVQTVLFPVKARAQLVETVGMAVLKINEMESAIAFGVDQTANLSDITNENAVKAFNKARKKAEVSLAAASAYLTVSTQEPRVKGGFANDKLIYKEIIYVLHQIIDRMENVLQLRLQLGSAVLENYYAAAITITLFAVHEALTTKLPLPQYFPSARLAQLRMVNRVRQILMDSDVTAATRTEEAEPDDSRRMLRVEFMSYNAASAALEQVIEWLEELVDLTKLLRGAAEFRMGLLSRPTYKEWVRQISVGGGVDGSVDKKPQDKTERPQTPPERPPTAPPTKQPDEEAVTDDDDDEDDMLPGTLERMRTRHRENRAEVRRLSQSRLSQSSRALPDRFIEMLEPREHRLLGRLLDLAREEDLVEDRIHLVKIEDCHPSARLHDIPAYGQCGTGRRGKLADVSEERIEHLDEEVDGLELVIVRVDADAEEEARVAAVDDLVVAELSCISRASVHRSVSHAYPSVRLGCGEYWGCAPRQSWIGTFDRAVRRGGGPACTGQLAIEYTIVMVCPHLALQLDLLIVLQPPRLAPITLDSISDGVDGSWDGTDGRDGRDSLPVLDEDEREHHFAVDDLAVYYVNAELELRTNHRAHTPTDPVSFFSSNVSNNNTTTMSETVTESESSTSGYIVLKAGAWTTKEDLAANAKRSFAQRNNTYKRRKDWPGPHDYAGLCYSNKLQGFSACSVIESNGDIELPAPGISLISSNSYSTQEHSLKVAAQTGLAAGKVYFLDPRGLGTITQSGFWLEGGFFLTVNSSLPDRVLRLCSLPNNKLASVTSTRYSKLGAEKDTRKIYLDQEFTPRRSTIGIWRLQDGESHPPHAVKLTQLSSLDQYDGHDFTGATIISAGYNGDDDTLYEASTTVLIHKLPPDVRNKLDPAQLKPNQRVLSVGKLVKIPSPFSSHDTCLHSVSGWLGICGAMMGIPIEDFMSGPRIEVFGLFRGGSLYEYANLMVPFTRAFINLLWLAVTGYDVEDILQRNSDTFLEERARAAEQAGATEHDMAVADASLHRFAQAPSAEEPSEELQYIEEHHTEEHYIEERYIEQYPEKYPEQHAGQYPEQYSEVQPSEEPVAEEPVTEEPVTEEPLTEEPFAGELDQRPVDPRLTESQWFRWLRGLPVATHSTRTHHSDGYTDTD
ncbi:LOW QUALITY PROTEIN: hypothetical protein Dda_8781 [Drechslerella dactyloides]|uniref:ER transporter 6TM N-terminal domain-containing protein n=1 Tax=Drechslerella dactyloides TaxID=74499 RepID=A0AAD6NFK4_DREDA|nr:LOW QUALITY PROTEIN: hypothetical protein Dda_8781 [Drechslerella dactyloides]